MNFEIAKLSKSKDKLDNFCVEFPEDAYGKSVELGEKTGLEAIKRVYSKMNVNNL